MASPSEATVGLGGELRGSLRRLLRPRVALAAAVGLAVLLLSGPLPVLDEESYLEIGGQLDLLHPYSWWRAWPPWGNQREADAFVYAHPPLFLEWVALWMRAALGRSAAGEPAEALIWPLKVAAALPWAGLLGWCVGRLCERWGPHPWRAAALWLSAPVSLLIAQRGLMPDLMATALGASAMTAWVEAVAATEPGLRRRWALWSGLSLAAAALTKYPAALLLLPLLWDLRRAGPRVWRPALGAAALLFLGVELALFIDYGRPHLAEVLLRAPEIPRGPLLGRGLGVAARLGLVAFALPLAARSPAGWWAAAAAVAAALCLLGAPPGAEPGTLLQAWVWASAGLLALAPALRAARRPTAPPEDRLLAFWALAVIGGVVLGHNYAAPRYLAPAAAPLALLWSRELAGQRWAGALLAAAVALQASLGLGISAAERSFAVAADEAARALDAQTPPAGDGAGAPHQFTGEWTFRWRLRQRGWAFWDGVEALPPGARLAVPAHSSPAALPPTLRPGPETAVGRGGLRLLDAPRSVGLYSETTGVLPLGWSEGPIESARLWTRSPAPTP